MRLIDGIKQKTAQDQRGKDKRPYGLRDGHDVRFRSYQYKTAEDDALEHRMLAATPERGNCRLGKCQAGGGFSLVGWRRVFHNTMMRRWRYHNRTS